MMKADHRALKSTSRSRRTAPETRPATRSIALALQGGGSHGAFTWGVLERLLEERRIRIDAISGTSAGAMNAVVLADGLHRGGRSGARAALAEFWRTACDQAAWPSLAQRTLWDRMTGNWSLNFSPAYLMGDLLSRLTSPYEFNPLNFNPLLGLLRRQVDFDAVRRCVAVRLFVPATNVRTGRLRIFGNADLSPEAVMASACVPHLFQAVEIDGQAYWDGGYSGNPALHPIIYQGNARDILIVQVNPVAVEAVPRSAREILDRVSEITFNSGLLAELRAIRFVTRQIDQGHLDPGRYKRVLIHRIDGQVELDRYDASTKSNLDWAFVQLLREKGRHAADAWLAENFEQIGVRSTLDLDTVLE